MGNAQANQVWVTIQSHVNIIAVAALAGIPAIIIAHGYEPERETLEKAKEEGIEIFTTKLDSFSIIRTLILEKGCNGHDEGTGASCFRHRGKQCPRGGVPHWDHHNRR
ncbi:MAG: DRTGG domain-containing protein [Clostridia bacterium]